MSLIDTGPPMTYPRGELVGVAGRVSWQWEGSIGMSLVHPNGSARPWIPWCGYSVITSAECLLNLPIVAPSVTDIARK
jgi:hypothetical protein